MSHPDETGRFELAHRPGIETPCPQLFSTCPSPSTGSSPGPMRDRTTASVMAGKPARLGAGRCAQRCVRNPRPPVRGERPSIRRDDVHRRGRRRHGTFEPADGWGGDHHDGVPIFILTRHDPDDLRQWQLVTYVSDVTSAMTQAKEAAGDKNVMVHGAGTAQLALAAGVLDEIELHVIPVLLGQGRRLFDERGPEHIELERTRILEGRMVSPTCTTESGPEVIRRHCACAS